MPTRRIEARLGERAEIHPERLAYHQAVTMSGGERRIVIVGGPPASGKTTLARRLAADFSLPLITKDGIKEALFESVGIGDREWSQRLGRGSFALVWHVLEAELAAGRSVLIEGNFDAAHSTAELERLRQRFNFAALQIHCRAPVQLLYERYRQRVAQRHAGHVDGERIADIDVVLDPERYLLPLPDKLVVADTTLFGDLEYQAVQAAVRAHFRA